MPLQPKKSQIAVTDLFAALVIITLVITGIMFTLNKNSERLNEKLDYDNMQLKAIQLADVLTKTAGKPTNWQSNVAWQNNDPIEIVGFATIGRVISQEKIQNFSNLVATDYDLAKELMNIEEYEFYLALIQNSNKLFEAGILPSGINKTVSIRRQTIYNNEPSILELKLWENELNKDYQVLTTTAITTYIFSSSPELAFEEDLIPPMWTTELGTIDNNFARAEDEAIFESPDFDYIQLDFPDLGISSMLTINSVTLTFYHQEFFGPPGDKDFIDENDPSHDPRHMIVCWEGNDWTDINTYPTSETWTSFSIDLTSCINTVALANNANIRITFDPAFRALGHIDVDFAEIEIEAY